jgi:outer membrane protein OmpA-like peptidoglycan-associated protein
MCQLHRIRLSRLVMATSGFALMLGGSALAQTIRVFDDAPSMDQLRSIMIPESEPGTGRTIVIQRPDTGTPSVSAQRVATQPLPAPRTPVAAADVAAPVAETVAANVAPRVEPGIARTAPVAQHVVASAAAPRPVAAKGDSQAKPGTVGFRINFAFNSAILPDQANTMIDRVAELMKEAPDIKVRVEGHTDAIGSADYNVSLSERRALSVAAYLVKRGIDPSRLVLVGKGMAEPLTANPYDPNNRRVQFVRVG